jgi:hypothetical protein
MASTSKTMKERGIMTHSRIMCWPPPCWTACCITRRRLISEARVIACARNARRACSMIWLRSLQRVFPPPGKHKGRNKAKQTVGMMTCRSIRKEGQRFPRRLDLGNFMLALFLFSICQHKIPHPGDFYLSTFEEFTTDTNTSS